MSLLLSVSGLPDRRVVVGGLQPLELLSGDLAPEQAGIRVDPAQLDAALRSWHEAHGSGDSALAIDGKTIRGAIDADGNQAHVLGIVGHDTKASWGQKKSA